MPYLNFIKDNDLEEVVLDVLAKGIKKKNESRADFHRNVVDPFAALFESASFDLNHDEWLKTEITRQCQKTLQNQIGTFHQKLLGKVDGWEDLGIGGIVDLVSQKERVVAEIKNKYNTLSGGKLAGQYKALKNLVMPKNSSYKGYKAYFVTIIPKQPVSFDIPFIPSDPEEGERCPSNPLIRTADGSKFYELVTGSPTALRDLYSVLPSVIENVFIDHIGLGNFK